MKHLLICGEYPPAPSGGIGTYAKTFSRLLAESGETVHVIGRLWDNSDREVEEQCDGRLIVHRVPYEDWATLRPRRPHWALRDAAERALFASDYPPQSFSWRAALLAERLVEEQGIDVIEAQEYEALFYYFQLRRALGWGPERRPPCLVHLHSPTELVAWHNRWEMTRPDVQLAKRLEDYSIAAADALVCPSGYLARQAEAHYGLADGSIQTIPYPLGELGVLKRDKSAWNDGSVCFVGRLEPRKGVLEWVEAAVAVAREFPKVQFEFVGADTWDRGRSVRARLERRIPKPMRMRFHFRGPQKHSALPGILERARMAVVPSRWDNFPYTCMEAMASGLPVVASREGGMAEMISDGASGWLAAEPGAEGLASALRRALRSSAAELERMGEQAAADIRRLCGHNRSIESQLAFRRELVRRGAGRSARLPAHLPLAQSPLSAQTPRRSASGSMAAGIGVVVACAADDREIVPCLRAVAEQTQKPAGVVVAMCGPSRRRGAASQVEGALPGAQTLHLPHADLNAGQEAALATFLDAKESPLGVVVLSTADRLEPGYLETCESILKTCSEVGVVSCWGWLSSSRRRLWIKPCPSFPYQLITREAAPWSVLRTEALREIGSESRALPERGDGDLAARLMAAGWTGVTAPAALVRRRHSVEALTRPVDAQTYESIRRKFPHLATWNRNGSPIGIESASMLPGGSRRIGFVDRLAALTALVREPKSTAAKVCWRLKNKFLRIFSTSAGRIGRKVKGDASPPAAF